MNTWSSTFSRSKSQQRVPKSQNQVSNTENYFLVFTGQDCHVCRKKELRFPTANPGFLRDHFLIGKSHSNVNFACCLRTLGVYCKTNTNQKDRNGKIDIDRNSSWIRFSSVRRWREGTFQIVMFSGTKPRSDVKQVTPTMIDRIGTFAEGLFWPSIWRFMFSVFWMLYIEI